jgi:hypothetical protein
MRPIDVTIGEFRLGGTFRLVYLLHNTTTNRTTQEEQIQTFHNVAAPAWSCSVIEDYIPELAATARETTRLVTATLSHVGYEGYQVATQIAISPTTTG